jgi:predicted AlkP superfamily phosphohydrolase/phosphomutase
MPNDTKALLAGVFDRDAFLAQSEIVLAERERMLEAALTRFGGGLLFFYVPSVDLVSHMFYRTLDGDAPADRAYSAVIPDVYERVDAMVGRARQALRSGDVLVVMSDHGFGPYDRRAHVNSYLAASGFLVLQGGARVSGPLFAGVDWSRSRAYALGLNSLFLNLAGREAGGVVDGASKDRVLGDVERALRDWRDEDGTAVVSAVMRPAAFADGDRVPDLLIGFARGYRASDASALGEIGPRAVDRNDTAWTGDHCVDPALVPGVLLANVPVRPGGALTDLAATLRGVLLGGSDGGALLSVEAR